MTTLRPRQTGSGAAPPPDGALSARDGASGVGEAALAGGSCAARAWGTAAPPETGGRSLVDMFVDPAATAGGAPPADAPLWSATALGRDMLGRSRATGPMYSGNSWEKRRCEILKA